MTTYNFEEIDDDSFAKLLSKKAKYLRIKNTQNVDSDNFCLGDKLFFENSADVYFEIADIQKFGDVSGTVLFIFEPEGLEPLKPEDWTIVSFEVVSVE